MTGQHDEATPVWVGDTAPRKRPNVMGAFPAGSGVVLEHGVVADVAGKCLRVFGPSTCDVYDPSNLRPLNHRCATLRASPHVCTCWECGAGTVGPDEVVWPRWTPRDVAARVTPPSGVTGH